MVDCSFTARVNLLRSLSLEFALSFIPEKKPQATRDKVCWKRLSSQFEMKEEKKLSPECDVISSEQQKVTPQSELMAKVQH